MKSSPDSHGGAEPAALEWNDLAVILAVCRAGSLSGAARTLGQNHSTIFRKVNAIESKTGVRFFERLAHGYEPTQAGETAQRFAERVESEFHALGREVLGQDGRLRGKVRITAPEGFSLQLAPRILAEFRRSHPDVSVEILGGHSAMDLSRREADIAIRATRKPPDASLGRRVCLFRFALYSSDSYLKRSSKKTPLAEHDWCLVTEITSWLVPLVWKKKEHGARSAVFSSNSSQAVLAATAEGMGVTLLPCYLADRDERLVRVSAPVDELTLELWVLTHADLRHTARVKALRDFMYSALENDRAFFEGKRGKRSKIRFKQPF